MTNFRARSFFKQKCQRPLVYRVVSLCAFLLSACLVYAEPNKKIHLSHIGFPSTSPKIAVVAEQNAVEFFLYDATNNVEILKGPLGQAKHWDVANQVGRIADFSDVETPGQYYIKVPGVGRSHTFAIGSNPYQPLLDLAAKAFYYNRASVAIEPEFAGPWHRPAAHPDTLIYPHVSFAKSPSTQGRLYSAPKGWYDAGDYNKYVVNGAFTIFMLLKTWEDTGYAASLNIPESSNAIPDLLDEVLWGLDWFVEMQDPADGGVFHKLSTLKFTGNDMPHVQNIRRYMLPKSTSATLNYAAVLAYAARLFAQSELPSLKSRSKLYQERAESAWRWAKQHANMPYNQPSDVNTGQYERRPDDYTDEFAWAATELFALTGDKVYLKSIDSALQVAIPEWGQYNVFAMFNLLQHDKVPTKMKKPVAEKLTAYGERLLKEYWQSSYLVPMLEQDFQWGSNGIAMSKAILYLKLNDWQPNAEYVHAARALLDYVLGRNPLGQCYLTGAGFNPPRHVHHRISFADGVADPVPGMLAGGPQAGKQDKCAYTNSAPALHYLDDYCSYSTNEVAINWNAALIYVLAVFSEKANKN